LLRPRIVKAEIQRGRESLSDLDARLIRAFHHRLRRAEASLETSSRVLETLSYRAVLARGFVLVRGADDVIKRHASAVKLGNALTLTFADGEVKATGVGAPVIRPPRRGIFKLKGQGDLF